MKFKWLRSNKNNLKFSIVLAIIGIIIGVVLYTKQTNEVKLGITTKLMELAENITTTKQNSILFHLALISILLILSLTAFALPAIIFYYFYEFVSIGYLLSSLVYYKKVSGLLFGSIFVVINKVLFLMVLTYFLINSINYTKRFLTNLKGTKNDIITNQLYKGIFVLSIIFINDIFLHFVGNKLLSIFIFLI
jgi:hypothetical protein